MERAQECVRLLYWGTSCTVVRSLLHDSTTTRVHFAAEKGAGGCGRVHRGGAWMAEGLLPPRGGPVRSEGAPLSRAILQASMASPSPGWLVRATPVRDSPARTANVTNC
eukprot:1178780-Prorocentrum_minimum.AAC.8